MQKTYAPLSNLLGHLVSELRAKVAIDVLMRGGAFGVDEGYNLSTHLVDRIGYGARPCNALTSSKQYKPEGIFCVCLNVKSAENYSLSFSDIL